ncbi:MAG: META domain-containing protein [Treponema sp.]|jgi:heat shock protein HslJ|nr:META domain-containing protein [Treponema sp.]
MRIGAFVTVVSLGVLLSACTGTPPVTGSEAPGFEAVTGKEWRLAELRNGAGVGFSRDTLNTGSAGIFTLEFQDGMVFGRGAPNTYRAPFERGEGQNLGIRPGAATLMAPLGEPEGLTEGEYFKYLERVYRWNLDAGTLELHTRDENGMDAVLVYRLSVN